MQQNTHQSDRRRDREVKDRISLCESVPLDMIILSVDIRSMNRITFAPLIPKERAKGRNM